MVEQLICNQPVGGSNPFASYGDMAEWTNASDCKSDGASLRWFESIYPQLKFKSAGVAQLARASAFQAEGRGFESRFPLFDCPGSSVVEHILGKDEVGGSIPLLGF